MNLMRSQFSLQPGNQKTGSDPFRILRRNGSSWIHAKDIMKWEVKKKRHFEHLKS